MKADRRIRWFVVIISANLALVPLFVSSPVRADPTVSASLNYAISPQPYQNSAELNASGIDTRVAVDRDPASPYYGTIYAASGSTVERSLDGGRSFNLASTINVCAAATNPCPSSSPDIVVGRHGLVYLVYADTVFRSGDEGVTWLAVAVFSAFGGSPSLGADNATGTVYVADVNSSAVVLLSRSSDDGNTWTRPVAIAGGATVATPQLAALRDEVAVAFLSTAGGPCGPTQCAYVSVAASHDAGDSWPTVTAVSHATLTAATSPSIAVASDGTLAVSWFDAVAGDTSATYVSVSRDHGSTFSVPTEVSRYPGVPYIGSGDSAAFDNDSRLYLAWESFNVPSNGSFSGESVFVGSSADLGQNFTQASFSFTVEGQGTNGSSEEHLAAGLDGHVYLTWFDFHAGHAVFRGVAGEASGNVVSKSQLGPGFSAEVEVVDNATGTVQAEGTWTGSPLRFDELPPNLYAVWVRIGSASARAGVMPVQTWNTTAFTVNLEVTPSPTGGMGFIWITGAEVSGVIAVAAAALVSFQHTRLTREQLLQRKVRLLIFEKIQGDPGSSFSQVRDALGLKNGAAAYHLRVLEKQGLIHTEKGRSHRWYYPNGDVSLWRDLPLSPLQRSLVDHVRLAPGIGIRELARHVNRHHASVSYNVRSLVREGRMRTERKGRKVHCFPSDENAPE